MGARMCAWYTIFVIYSICSIRRRGYYYSIARYCAATIRERRLFLSALLDTAEVEESDPFAGVEEDENELEENEAVLEDC